MKSAEFSGTYFNMVEILKKGSFWFISGKLEALSLRIKACALVYLGLTKKLLIMSWLEMLMQQWCTVHCNYKRGWIRTNKISLGVIGADVSHSQSNQLLLFPLKAVHSLPWWTDSFLMDETSLDQLRQKSFSQSKLTTLDRKCRVTIHKYMTPWL